MEKTLKNVDDVVIRFAGDSGDGMQLTGGRFTDTTAIVGNDLSTLPDFPAEIRAPAGSLAGVSAFQIHFSSRVIYTPGDKVDVLVAMNPAALKVQRREQEKKKKVSRILCSPPRAHTAMMRRSRPLNRSSNFLCPVSR